MTSNDNAKGSRSCGAHPCAFHYFTFILRGSGRVIYILT